MTETARPYRVPGEDPVGRCRVRWRGAEFVLWGTSSDAGLMTDDAAIDAGEAPYAWVGPDGTIYRHGRSVGSAAELEYLEEWRA